MTLGTSVFSSLIRGSRHQFVLLSFHSSLKELPLRSCCFLRLSPHCSDGSRSAQCLLSRDAHVTQSSQLPAASSHHCGRTEQTGSPGWRKQKSNSGLCLALLRSLLFNKAPKLSRMEGWNCGRALQEEHQAWKEILLRKAGPGCTWSYNCLFRYLTNKRFLLLL